ncbi:hypothetical protein [Promicromonospora sp. NFX87]|uniref:hypothetical protein n=1 Tax=Promicromonospora sp. NFX87 TaxID=3402691 RepID=UPI003AFB4758
MMTDPEQILGQRDEQAVLEAVGAARREQAALEALGGRRWFAAPLASFEREEARFERWINCHLVSPARWDKLAAEDITTSMHRFQSVRETLRNPFHPRTLEILDEVAAFILERRGVRDGFADVVDDLPPLAKRLNQAGIEEYIRAEIARRQAVAADPVLLVKHQQAELNTVQSHRAGEQWLIVQHKASGMRSRFMYKPDQVEGKVYARPFGIASIDPDRIEDPQNRAPEWQDYAGLGIGTKLYLRATEELPDVRWGATSVSPYAEPLRTKLHAIDPWRWRSRMCSCYETWGGLTRQAFAEAVHEPAVRDSEA